MGNKQVRSIDAVAEDQSIANSDLPETVSLTDTNSSTTPSLAVDTSAVDIAQLDDPRSVELSEPFVQRWSILVSTTNWEKGSIICAWRSELEGQGAPVSAYSDEAWSRRVGGVTSQHVGRLRRVYQRFGNSFKTYSKLYWTHFLAALDWDDAEMWLEGATQSGWSVSQMRQTRWQASGGDPATAPASEDIVAGSIDEDYAPSAEPLRAATEEETRASKDISEGPRYDGPDFGDEPSGSNSVATADADEDEALEDVISAEPLVSPFASLPTLPVDVADALEQFKLAIIRHRASEWTEISREDMLRTVDALRAFTVL